MTYLTADDIRSIVLSRIGKVRLGRPPRGRKPPRRSQKSFANSVGMSEIVLSQFLHGDIATPNRTLLLALGFEPQPYWKKKL